MRKLLILERRTNGIFYTPLFVVKLIVTQTVGKWLDQKKQESGICEDSMKDEDWEKYLDFLSNITILDPACGTGAFLIESLKYLIKEWQYVKEILPNKQVPSLEEILTKNIFGVDINEGAIKKANLSLWLTTIEEAVNCDDIVLENLNINLKCTNSLEYNFDKKFDIIIGNPPWSALSIDEYTNLKTNIAIANHNSCWYFFIKAMGDWSHPESCIGLLMPISWLSNLKTKNIREEVLKKKELYSIIDFGKIFKSISERCAAIILRNNNLRSEESVVDSYSTPKRSKVAEDIVFYDTIIIEKADDEKWTTRNINTLYWLEDINYIIKFDIDIKALHLIKLICSNCKKMFEDFARLSSGVECNGYKKIESPYISTEPKENYQPIVDAYGDFYQFVNVIPQKYVDYNNKTALRRSPPKEIFNRPKILIKRCAKQIIATMDESNSYVEHSLKVVNHKKDTNIFSLKYLLGLLNSKLLNFIYQAKRIQLNERGNEIKSFGIEKLPIPDFDGKYSNKIVEYVDLLLKEPTNQEINDKLNQEVYQLYGLTASEIYICENNQ